MQNMHKLLKSVSNLDTISFEVFRSTAATMHITIENTEKSAKTLYKLNLLDIDQHNMTIPDTFFDSVMTMPSNDLQRICRDMNVLSDYVTFESSGSELILTCVGDFASQSTCIGQTSNGLLICQNQNPHSSTEVEEKQMASMGTFSLKYLNLFSRATNLSGTVDIYLKNKYPLILMFSVASLGKLLFVLAPQQQDSQDA